MPVRRRSLWIFGIAALVTVIFLIVVALWFAFRSDASHSRSVAPTPPATVPTATGSASSAPSPSGLHAVAQAREDQADRLASEAGNAGRSGADGASSGTTTAAEPLDDADIAVARNWLETALTWRENEASLGPWGRAVDRANAKWAAETVEQIIVPATALDHIASDAAIHGAPARVVDVADKTDPEWDAPNVVTLAAAIVFGTGDGWTRPGLRLLVTFEVADGKVTSVFIDDGYVISDPELLP